MLKFLPKSRFLLVRTDNIGDVLLTTPAAASLRRKYPQAFIAFLCKSYTAPLFLNNPDINQVLLIDDNFPFGLINRIKELKFDCAIHFFIEPRSAFVTHTAKIPFRIGPNSKIWSSFLSHKIVQNRSLCEKHEAEYNLDLVKEVSADGLAFPPRMVLNSQEKREGQNLIHMVCKTPEARPIVIHAGSHGSVEVWPLKSFLELGVKIAARGECVIFTAGKGEEHIVEEVQKLKNPAVQAFAAGSLTLRSLASVIGGSKMFIGNSSGPLHIATSLMVPTISFFPKAPLVTSAKRWGPFGNFRMNRVLLPANDSLPLSSITPEFVLEWVINVLQSKQVMEDESGQN